MSIQSDLKRLLLERRISQKEFAALVGINQSALSRFLHSTGCTIAERIVPYIYGEKNAMVRPPARKKKRAKPSQEDSQ